MPDNIMGVTHFLLLASLGLALTVQAQECPKPVPKPNMNLKGDDILKQTFPDGAKVYFVCEVGYAPAGGSPEITCTAGSWSAVTLTCTRKSCGSAGEVANGQIDYPQGSEFGDRAVVTCDDGYILVGKKEILCGDKGWMDRLPSCEVVKCLSAPDVADATYYPIKEVYEYRDVVQYTCARDLTLNGSKSLTCEIESKFTPEPPKCIKVECEDPQIANAFWESGSRPPHRFSSTVTFRCRDKYVMKGQGSLTCNINSKWSPGLPTCELAIKPTEMDKGTTTTSTPPAGGGNKSVPILIGVFVVAMCGAVVAVFIVKCKRKRSSPFCP